MRVLTRELAFVEKTCTTASATGAKPPPGIVEASTLAIRAAMRFIPALTRSGKTAMAKAQLALGFMAQRRTRGTMTVADEPDELARGLVDVYVHQRDPPDDAAHDVAARGGPACGHAPPAAPPASHCG